VKGTIILADSAQDDPNGKLHALGAGWSVTSTPTPPMALLVLLDCPWDQTNKKHKMIIDLVDADGHAVSFGQGPMGNPEPAVHLEIEFEVGRPPGMPPGNPQRQPLSINLGPGMPLTAGQKYEFRMTIDGKHQDSWLSTFMIRP
jgi:hypothetical protein